MKKILSPAFSLKLKKYYFIFERRLNFFFKWSYSQRCFDLAQCYESRCWIWQRCFHVVLRFSIQLWKIQCCLNVVQCRKFQRWCTQRYFNVDLTLRDVASLERVFGTQSNIYDGNFLQKSSIIDVWRGSKYAS